MMQRIARNLMLGVTLAALMTPGAFATPTGTDPVPPNVTQPSVVQTILTFLGLA